MLTSAEKKWKREQNGGKYNRRGARNGGGDKMGEETRMEGRGVSTGGTSK